MCYYSLINRLCMSSYGERALESAGSMCQAACGIPEWKVGGVTIDWSTVTAVSGADVTLPDGQVIKIGDKYIRYGTPVDRITATAEVEVIDLSAGNDPTAGTWTITYTDPLTGVTYTTAALAWDASAAVVLAALEDLEPITVGQVSVAKSGFQYTITFSGTLGNVTPVTIGSASLTGATSVTVTTTGAGNAKGGFYGPVDTTASDGRQTMARGETFIVNETVVLSNSGSDHPAVFDGGRVFQGRLNVGGTGQATLANLLTAMPRLQLINE